MTNRIISVVFLLSFMFSVVPPLEGFDNNPNWVDPNDKSKGIKEYTGEKAPDERLAACCIEVITTYQRGIDAAVYPPGRHIQGDASGTRQKIL